MAVIGSTFTDLMDLYRQSGDNREIADIIEIMSRRDEMMQDAPALEANQGMTNLTTVRAGLPAPTFWAYYMPVLPTKGTTSQVRDATAMLIDWAECDAELADAAKNPAKFRMNNAKAHIEGLTQAAANTVVYGNAAANPLQFTGLAPRFNSLGAGNGAQIIDAGGTGSDNTSIWFVTWGENSVHLIYPEGTTGGLKRTDIGRDTKELATGLYEVYREKYLWHIGLAVADWRGVARVANIQTSALTKTAVTGADLIDLMIDGYYRLDNANQPGGKTVIYTSRIVAAFLHKQAANKANVNLTLETASGKPVVSFLGHPIRRMDAILNNTEARVVA